MRRFNRLLPKAILAGLAVGLAIALALGGSMLFEHRAQIGRLEGTTLAMLRSQLAEDRDTRLRDASGQVAPAAAAALAARDVNRAVAALQPVLRERDVVRLELVDARGTRLLDATGLSAPERATSLPLRQPLVAADGTTVGALLIHPATARVLAAEATVRERFISAEHKDRNTHASVLMAAAALALFGCVGMAWWLGGGLRNTIVQLRRGADRMASGDYSRPVDVLRQDELGELAHAVEQLRQRLKATTISRNYLDTVLNSMADAVVVTSPEGVIKRTNEATARLFGWSEGDLVGREFAFLLTDGERAGFDLTHAANENRETVVQTQSGQTIPVALSGSIISADDPQFQGCIFIIRNITERKRAERRIRYLARYDTLTKIPNRMQFQHLLQQALARNLRAGSAVALLYLDMDRFKEVNDTFGHSAGDRTLEVLTERLVRILPKDAVVGRLAGDEFAVFVEGLPGEDPRVALAPLCRQLLDGVGGAFWLQGNEVYLTASLGIALAPRDAENVIDLIRNADAAMYHSKQNGGNSYAFYSTDMNTAAVERLMLKSKLRRSLERDEFVMLYQPKVDLRTGRVVGAEALLRWRLPGHGDIPPAQFIPIAEETNLILAIGEWVLRHVCKDYAAWQQVVLNPGRVSINLSLKQLRQASFITRCQSVFKESGVSPTCFELEITETTLMSDAKRTVKLLDELYAMGVHLSIDDFGTGYSSLSALQQLPVGTLKIDQSFVRNAATDADDATLVRTIIDMGRSMELQVVAEGVETPAQLAFLRAHGCHYAQGMLLGEPMSGASFLMLLSAQARGERVLAKHFA